MKKTVIDVTKQVAFHQSFNHRMIEDSEYFNKTKYGCPLELDSVKVVDITSMANLGPYLQELEQKLTAEKKSRGSCRNENISIVSKDIEKIKTGNYHIYLVYFRIEYKNKLFGQGQIKYIYNDYYCSLYIDGEPRAGNMQAYWHLMNPLKNNKEGFRSIVKERLNGVWELNTFGINVDEVIQLMIENAPRKKLN